MPPLKVKQLELTREDRQALSRRIELDWQLDSRDMDQRNVALRRWYQKWRASPQATELPEEQASNFHIPMIQWIILSKLAKEIDALLGDEAEVVVRPVGQADIDRAPKIQRYMNWRIKVSLKLFKKLYDYLLQKNILGTTGAFLPWVKRTRTVRKRVFEKKQEVDEQTGLVKLVDDPEKSRIREVEVVDFEGPDLQVENIEDWALPANAKSIDEADHFSRRLRLSVDELLDMVDEGKLDEDIFTDEFTKKLRMLAETGHLESTETDSGKQVRDEKDIQQGRPTTPEGRDDKLTAINWNGKWRSPKADPKDRAEEIVAFWQPDTKELLGASRLVDMFQDGRRPFIKSELVRDLGTPWGIGLPEMLESINDEMDMQHNAMTDAGVFGLGPVVFYEPASGFPAQSFKLRPFTAYATANAGGIKVVNFAENLNMAPYVNLQPQLLGFAERVSGITEAELGRPFSQPNSPRTLGQQQIIQQGSGVRILLDLRSERESLRELLNRIWDMDKRFLPKPVFFRVAETDPGELLTDEEMQGDFDFDIGPLTGVASKQQDLMNLLQAFALGQNSPIVAQNPGYQAAALKKINEKLGHSDLNAFLPDLSKMRPPMTAEEENQRLLAGEDVDPHPQDNHVAHIAKHSNFKRQIEENEIQRALADRNNPGLLGRIDAHIAEHEFALRKGAPPQFGQAQQGQQQGQQQPQQQQLGQAFSGGGNPVQNQLASILNQGNLNIA